MFTSTARGAVSYHVVIASWEVDKMSTSWRGKLVRRDLSTSFVGETRTSNEFHSTGGSSSLGQIVTTWKVRRLRAKQNLPQQLGHLGSSLGSSRTEEQKDREQAGSATASEDFLSGNFTQPAYLRNREKHNNSSGVAGLLGGGTINDAYRSHTRRTRIDQDFQSYAAGPTE